MYTIVALVYLIAAGTQVGEPLRITHKNTFNGLEACQAFLKSEEFAGHRQQLSDKIMTKLTSIRLANPEEDTDNVLPDLAITASCEPDERL